MDAKLFERVRVLTQELGDVQLIGSLAGGRKTMSAGLQGAFSMLGREGDRLVHVLLEPRVEEHVRKHLDFAFPCVEVAQVTGVGLNEQITLHDVHFPRLLDLLRRGRLQHQAIVDLIAEDYPTFLRSMSRCQARRTATLQRSARTAFFYTVVVDGDDREPQVVTLSQAVGHTLAALIEVGGRASLKELQGALAKHDSVKNDEIDRNAVSQRLKELERALKDFPRLGLSEFALSRPARSQYLVEAAVEGLITVDPHDLWD